MPTFPPAKPEPPYNMREMIRTQPAFVRETARRVGSSHLRSLLGSSRNVVVTGCGTSFHASCYGARVLSGPLAPRRHVEAVQAYDLHRFLPSPARTTVIGVSHSGNTPTTNRALRRARHAGARIVGICGLPDTPMEALTDATLAIGSVHDRSWANTMSYTTQLAAFGAIATYLGNRDWTRVSKALHRLPEALDWALRCEPMVRRLARSVASRDRVTFLGGGLDEITALEAALKIRETCSMPASGYHVEQFLHGPFLSLDRRESVVALVSRDDPPRARAILKALARTGARVTTVGDARGVDVPLPRVHPVLRPIVSVVPMQFLAYHAALERGVDPDVMRTDVPRYRPGVKLLFS